MVFNGAATVTGTTTLQGRVVIKEGLQFDGRVTRTAPMNGTTFANNTINGVNVCPAGFHPCTAFEAMTIEVLAANAPFDAQGWVVGGFPSTDFHLRSLTDGQDLQVCQAGSHLTKYPSICQHGTITSPGNLHCAADNAVLPVWCCRNKT